MTDNDTPYIGDSGKQCLLVACDFDHTLIDVNSDLVLFQQLPYGEALLPRFASLRQEDNLGWTQVMQIQLAELAKQEGYNKTDVLQCLHSIKMDPVLVSALRQLRSSQCYRSVNLIILSDANTIFINHILAANGLDEGVFGKVYTNPATWMTDDVIHVEPYQHVSEPHQCLRRCPANMCKTTILQRARRELDLDDDPDHVRTVYIGDGGNDLCPSLTLSESDVVLAREGYALQRLIAQTSGDTEVEGITAQVKTWKSGQELGEMLCQVLLGLHVNASNLWGILKA